MASSSGVAMALMYLPNPKQNIVVVFEYFTDEVSTACEYIHKHLVMFIFVTLHLYLN